MLEIFTIPKVRRSAAILALSGAAFSASGCGESPNDSLLSGPVVKVTVPPSGAIDTMSELFELRCGGELDQKEMDDAVYYAKRASNKNTAEVQPGEVLTLPVALCDRVQHD